MESPIEAKARLLCDDWIAAYDHSLTTMQSEPRTDTEAIQLAALQMRFASLRNAIPMLKKLSDRQGIDTLDSLDAVVPLLFDHTMYKSYPAAILYENRFDQLTRWLDKLTAFDLSGFDASGCRSVDEWMLEITARTPLHPNHTSGTTGTLSFLPRSKADWRKFMMQYPTALFQRFGDVGRAPEMPYNMHAIYPHFRSGGSHQVMNDLFVDYICGGEERLHTAYPGRLSSDVVLLSARIRNARSKGRLDSLEVSAELRARQAEFAALQEGMGDHIARFFDRLSRSLKGEKVFIQAIPSMFYQMAMSGLERGQRDMFHPDSVVICGGGAKGTVLPEDWEEQVRQYLGVRRITKIYGMSESHVFMPICEAGHYHLMPGLIAFVLDPVTSKPLPRKGRVTGRWAHFDLSPETMWGGFISGDEVTMDWDEPCRCGRSTPHIHDTIGRYSEKISGDDKITCAATEESYNEAMEFLTGTRA